MKRKHIAVLLAASLAATLSACGGGGGGDSTSAPSNPTPQPAVTISADNQSIVAGQSVTLTWSAQNTGVASCTASGAWSGAVPTTGSKTVATSTSPTPYTATYSITCGSATNSTSVAVAAAPTNNIVPVTVDGGVSTVGRTVNVPFVDVTICKPGTTVCQTIDHVLLDTGSTGLRVFTALNSSLSLPTVTAPSGAALGECGQFVSGYTWGSVLQADIKMGGEVATGQSIQLVGSNPGGSTSAPSSCSSVGNNIGSANALGANGILGVGLFKQDCGNACTVAPISGVYYQCANGTCSSTTVPLTQQISNPVASFAQDNNGVVLSFPSVSTGGASSLAGTMTFGIGTQANNALAGVTKFNASRSGVFSTTYGGTVLTSSFIDSGSNGLFFNDSSIAKCAHSTDFYCPVNPASLNATITAYDGSAASPVQFSIENVDNLGGTVTAASIGAPFGSAGTFDWGLPFFFGKKVFVGIESDTAAPYWAF